MGAWCVRDEHNPFKPGCSYETLRRLVERGKINAETIIRGPTTNQFWAFARDIQGVANLLGHCHNCHIEVRPDDYMCRACAAILSPNTDRQSLGLAPVRLLPGHAPPHVIARAAASQGAASAQPTSPSAVVDPSVRRVGAPASATKSTIAGNAHTTTTSDQPTDSAITAAATTRRLRRQLASVRAMIALLIVANFILLAFLAALVIQLRSSSPAPDTTQQEASTSTPAIIEQPPPDDPSPASNPAADDPIDTVADSSESAPAQSPIDQAPIDQAAANRAAARMAEALKLADLDTIKDVEQAVAILQGIARETPASAMPPGLDEHLVRLNARLDELYLRQAM